MVDVSGGFGTDSDVGGWGGRGDNYSGGWESQVAAGYSPDVGGSFGRGTVGYGGGNGGVSAVDKALSDYFGGLDLVSQYDQMGTDVAKSLANLTPDQLEQIRPSIEKMYGAPGKLGEKLMGTVLNVMFSSINPMLGLAAKTSGLTSKATGWLTDNAVKQELADMLGVSSSYGTSMDVLDAARRIGKSEGEVAAAYNLVSSRRGDGMGLWEDITGKSGVQAVTGATGTAVSHQQQALDYLREMGAMPLAAQRQLGQLYGVTGTPEERQTAMTGLRETPMYQAIMGGREAGEEAIMRQAGATGGLRSGGTQEALARYAGDLERQALMGGVAGLGGLAGYGTYAPQIAQGMTGMGQTLAAGQTQAEQARQAGLAQTLGIGGALYKELGGLSGIGETLGGAWSGAKTGYETGGLAGGLAGAIGGLF